MTRVDPADLRVKEWIAAAQNGEIAVVRAALARDPQAVAWVDASKIGALHFAASRNHPAIVELLLAHGAAVDAPGVNGWTPLMLASEAGNRDICLRLLAAGAEVNAVDGSKESAFFSACMQGHLDVCALLLDHGAEIDQANRFGHTALMRSAQRGGVARVAFLLERGANIKRGTPSGRCALDEAVAGGHVEVCQLLVAAGANVFRRAGISMPAGTKDFMGTSLHRAALAQQLDVLRYLKTLGMESSILPGGELRHNLSAFQFAVLTGRGKVVRYFLEECNEDVHQTTVDGQSMIALAGSHRAVTELLRSFAIQQAVQEAIDAVEGDVANVRSATKMEPL